MKNRIDADKKKTTEFHQYTVGEMATLLSISAPTIRFYDSQGAIVPHRDQENHYRKYTVVDGNYLLKLKELKNVGASLHTSEYLLNHANLIECLDGIKTIADEEEKRIKKQELLLFGLRRKIERIENLKVNLNQITICMRPDLWRLDHQIEDQFIEGDKVNQARKEWTDFMPLADLSFMFSCGDENHRLHWGFLIESNEMDILDMDKHIASHYPSTLCIYMTFSVENEVFLRYENLKPAINFMEKHAFCQSGDIIGRSIARVMSENNTVLHCYDVWIPIKECKVCEK